MKKNILEWVDKNGVERRNKFTTQKQLKAFCKENNMKPRLTYQFHKIKCWVGQPVLK